MPSSTAAQVAGWGNRGRRGATPATFVAPNSATGLSIDGGTGDTIGLKVELFLGGQWVDISPFVFYKNKIRITRGRPNETSQIQPQTATMTINNRDGRFSPRNPLGAYYGLIGRNTPIRVSRLQNGVRRYRFYGEVPSWPTTWDISGNDVRATITAAGPMRRLSQGAQLLKSTFYRVYGQGTVAVTPPVAYWPAEDGKNANVIASGLPGGTAMALSGQAPPTFGSNSSFVCSAALPLLAGSIWTGTVPSATTSANVLRFLMSVPATGAFDGGIVARMYTAGTVARVDVIWHAANGGYMSLSGYDSGNNSLFSTAFVTGNVAGLSVLVSVELTQSGGNVQANGYFAQQPYLIGVFGVYFSLGTSTVAGTIGAATQVVVNPLGQLNDTAVGHVVVQAALDSLSNVLNPFNGYLNDTPVARFQRLCTEQGVGQAVIGNSDTASMGFQTIDTFPTLIQQPGITNAGLLFEARGQAALVLRTKLSLYNQAAKLILDHSLHQLSGPLNPVDDDALTRNDVTVTRVGGSSVQLQQATGTLSIQAPPAGVGDYATSYNLSLGSDSQLLDQAGWRLHLGTVDQPRFPQISINLRHSTFTSNVDMMNAALTIDIGDRLVVTNPPPWMPPDQISQIVLGYTETLGIWEHDIVFNGAPEDPYRVGLLDDVVLGHLDTDGSTLALPAGPTDTTLTVSTTSPSSPSWTTNAADFPFDVAVGGERITVTSIATMLIGPDGTFESGVAGWNTTNATVAQSSAAAHSGTFSGLVTSVSNNAFSIFTGTRFAAYGGATFILSHWMKLASGTPTLEWAFINWYNAAGGVVGSTTTIQVNPSSTWTNQVVTSAIPATAVTGQMFIQATAAAGGDAVYVDDITLTLLSGGTQAFTVTRSVNGVVKSQPAGTDVRLWQPMYLSM